MEHPADEKLALLAQLYQRLVRIHESGKKAVVLIDEAQMLATRELMEEFRGLLNLEVPERKLLSFVFFGLPEIEDNLAARSAARAAGGHQVPARAAQRPTPPRPTCATGCGSPARRACPSPPARWTGSTRTPGARRASSTPSATTRLFEGFMARARELDERHVDRVAGRPRLRAATRRARAARGPGPAARPPGADLAEIDRYLESLK